MRCGSRKAPGPCRSPPRGGGAPPVGNRARRASAGRPGRTGRIAPEPVPSHSRRATAGVPGYAIPRRTRRPRTPRWRRPPAGRSRHVRLRTGRGRRPQPSRATCRGRRTPRSRAARARGAPTGTGPRSGGEADPGHGASRREAVPHVAAPSVRGGPHGAALTAIPNAGPAASASATSAASTCSPWSSMGASLGYGSIPPKLLRPPEVAGAARLTAPRGSGEPPCLRLLSPVPRKLPLESRSHRG